MCGRRGAPRGARRTHGPRRGRGEGGDSRRPRQRGRASGGGDGGSADRRADARSQASGPPREARAAKQGRRHERQATEARRAAPQAGTSCKPRRDAAGHGPTAGAPATRDEGQRRTALKAPAGPANAAQGPHGPQGARRSGPAVPPAARDTPKQSTPPRAAGGAMPLHTSFVGRRAGQQTDGRGGGPSPSGARRRRLAAANSPQHGRRQSAPHATDRTRGGTISKNRFPGPHLRRARRRAAFRATGGSEIRRMRNALPRHRKHRGHTDGETASTAPRRYDTASRHTPPRSRQVAGLVPAADGRRLSADGLSAHSAFDDHRAASGDHIAIPPAYGGRHRPPMLEA